MDSCMFLDESIFSDIILPISASCGLRLVEGFNYENVGEQPGGKGNTRYAIPKQVVQIQSSVELHEQQVQGMSVRVQIVAIQKNNERKLLTTDKALDETRVEKCLKYGLRASFPALIIPYSSVAVGEALALRFQLVLNHEVVCELDSSPFVTRTKRAYQKRAAKKRKLDSITESNAQITSCYPCVAPLQGGMCIKLMCQDLGNGMEHVQVLFGNVPARAVYYASPELIICEAPAMKEAGIVPITVRDTCRNNIIACELSFAFVNPNDPALLASIIMPTASIQPNYPQQQQFL